MARKYARDNRGRFASKGAGATARGGRLKTAGGNKREAQNIAALSSDRMSSVPKGAIGKTRKQRDITMIDRPQGQRVAYNQGRAQQKAAIAARKAPSTKKAPTKLQAVPNAAGRRTAALSGGRRINIHDNKKAGFSAALIGKNGAPRMERKGLRNVSAAKAWAANPNARGPRLMGGGLKTEASAKATWTRNAKPANTLGNKTGQSKTLNKFNSRPERTRGAYVSGRYVDKAKLTGRQPLDLGRGDDRAFGRVATKATRARAAAAKPERNSAGLTKAEYEAALSKAWGRTPKAATPKAKGSGSDQLDRLATRSGNMVRSRSGLTAAEARKASDLGRATGRRVEVTQGANGGYSLRVAPAKPAANRRAPIGKISEAKAGRIVARMDANRPGLRRASASSRKTANAIRTHQKATDFALASGARARKKGQNLSVNQSLQRAVANAAKKRKR